MASLQVPTDIRVSGGGLRSSKSYESISEKVFGDSTPEPTPQPHIEAYMGPLLLCSAASKGDLVTVKHLIEVQGVNPNEGDYDGRTALHLACEEGHMDVVKYFISKGVDMNAPDRWGATPLRGAISYNRRDIANLLKDAGASFTFTNPGRISLPQSSQEVVAEHQRNERLQQIYYNFFGGEKARDSNSSPPPVPLKKINKYLKDICGLVPKKNKDLTQQLKQLVVKETRPRAPTLTRQGSLANMSARSVEEEGTVTFESFMKTMDAGETLLQRALDDRLVIPNWASFCRDVEDIFESVRESVPSTQGHNADYIPELADVDPELFGLAIVTVDGQILTLGNWESAFSIQSCAKPLTYSLSSEIVGIKTLHNFVGQEPSGVAFNAFTLNKNKKPHNPLINSGAIMVCSLYKSDLNLSKRFRSLTEAYTELAGGEKIGFSQSVYLSEKNCAHRNFALAHFMAAEGAFPVNANILEAVDFYFQACSCEVNAFTLASIAATYANNGRSPLSGKRCLAFPTIKNALQLMYSCGMYDFSGEWACTVGLPAKSGVAGSIWLVIPDVLGMCVYAPPLNGQGNSVRGVEFCQRFAQKFNWSLLDVLFSKQYDNRKAR
eukprot:TRINITY_DN1286_c0_g1_i2.p1 TRINITY_DN1286_c0_g1~~TRINITY_DN1286_c0_g1_i2.p1  ORF type:complete len:607 (+),score=115.69 TRINITY_DN1286_c0_g1_i2:182-2002(+)